MDHVDVDQGVVAQDVGLGRVSHAPGSRKSSTWKSSAVVGENSGGLMSTPRTQYPSRLSRLTRCPAMKPPAPHTSALFTATLPLGSYPWCPRSEPLLGSIASSRRPVR